MHKTGSMLINILRGQETQMRLRFARMLMMLSAHQVGKCPFDADPPPPAIHFAKMPGYLRGAFLLAYRLRSQNNRAIATVYENAINDLLHIHFGSKLREHEQKSGSSIREFQLGRDWNLYAVPVEN